MIALEQLEALSKEFTGQEVKEAIDNMDSFKTPGPDEYNTYVYHKH